MIIDQESIGKRIKKIRHDKGFSQVKLAEKLNVTPGTIWHWEIGRSLPQLYNIIVLAKLLDVSIDYIVGVENNTDD